MLPVPVVGQLAIVRQRPFVVTEITPTAPGIGGDSVRRTHLIRLSSVEDDGLGEELQVIWELELGTAVHEQSTLPDPDTFDHPKRPRAFLDAVRWGAVSQRHRGGRVPTRSGGARLVHASGESADRRRRGARQDHRGGAGGPGDDPSARVRSVLIVCPSSLQVQWQEEMRDTFGLEFRIVDSESISQLRRKRAIHVNPWSHFPRLITSIDDVKLRARFANPSARLLPVAVTWLIPRCAVLDMGAPGPH